MSALRIAEISLDFICALWYSHKIGGKMDNYINDEFEYFYEWADTTVIEFEMFEILFEAFMEG